MIHVDGVDYDAQDAGRTVAALGAWWQQLAADLPTPASFDELRRQQQDLLAGSHEPDDVLAPSLALITRAAEILRAERSLPARHHGQVVQLNRSGGGVPKGPVGQIDVDWRGAVGDVQNNRSVHGSPWQALCIWSSEVIDSLAADGHPIGYGSAGENVTVSGLDWPSIHAGMRLRIGAVLVECTLFAIPCKKNAQWFSDGDFNRLHHARGSLSRIYARIVEPGYIATGDPVVVER